MNEQERREELKHYKDCLKVLQQPQMVGLVNDLDTVIARYKDKISLLSVDIPKN